MSLRLHRRLLCLAFLALSGFAFAAAPQSDDFNRAELGTTWGPFLSFSNDIEHTAQITNNLLALSGAGTQLLHYTSAEFLPQSNVTGNFDIRLHVLSVPQCNARSEVGLMIRQDLNEESVNWAQVGATRSDGVEMSTGSDVLPEDSGTGKVTPEWVRFVSYVLSDTERLIEGYAAENADGPWRLLRSVRMGMADPVFVGPFLRSQCGEDAMTGIEITGTGTADDFVSSALPDGGTFAVHATYSGQTDAAGNPLPAAGIWISVQKGGKEVAGGTTDAAGDAFIPGVPEGAVTISPLSSSLVSFSVDAQSQKGEVTNLDLEVTSNAPLADLSTAAGQAWELQLPARNASATAEEIAEAPSSDFVSATAPGKWNDGAASPNLYGWYRTKVLLSTPDTGTPPDLLLTGWNIDTQDWTYWNGVLIGSTNDPAATRSYVIPGRLVQPENDLVILAYNRFGEGGMTLSAPIIVPANATGRVVVNLVDANDKPFTDPVLLTAVSEGSTSFGDQSFTTQARLGEAVFSGLGAGTFTVTALGTQEGNADQVFSRQTVAAGQTLTLKATVKVKPNIGGGVVRGDVTGDGKVTIADAIGSLQLAVGSIPNPTDAQKQAGDVSGDGKLTVVDTIKILQFVVGTLPSL